MSFFLKIIIFCTPVFCIDIKEAMIKNQVLKEMESIKIELEQLLDPNMKLVKKAVLLGSVQAKISIKLERALRTDYEIVIWKNKYRTLKKKYENTERKMGILGNFSKKVACAKQIRYSLDVFPAYYLINKEQELVARNKLISDLRKHTKDREGILIEILSAIRSYSCHTQIKNEKSLLWHIKKLKTLAIPSKLSALPDTSSSTNEVCPFNSTSPKNLKDAIIKLIEEKEDEERIKRVLEEQNNYWEKFNLAYIDTRIEIESITRNYTAEEFYHYFDDAKINNMRHRNFIRETSSIGTIFDERLTNHYLDCIWTVYISRKEDIITITNSLGNEWPHLSHAERVDRFCTGYSNLYDFLSNSYFHSPNTDEVPLECRPQLEDYEKYLDNLSPLEKDSDFPLVARLVRRLCPNTTPKSNN